MPVSRHAARNGAFTKKRGDSAKPWRFAFSEGVASRVPPQVFAPMFTQPLHKQPHAFSVLPR